MSATAVIITGQPRTFARCWKTQREAVFRKLDNPYFFISFARVADITVGEAIEELKRAFPDRVHFEWVDQPEMPEDLRARFEAESYHAPYYRSVPVEGIWKQFWHLQRGWEFYVASGYSKNFDTFIRVRPDLHFHQFKMPASVHVGGWEPGQPIEFAPPPRHAIPDGVHVPWWGSWGGLPDRFAFIVGEEAAAQYFNVFHKLNELLAEGCAYHPETMLGRALERAGVRAFETLDAEFTTIRQKGDKRPHDAPVYTPRDWARIIGRLAATAD